MSVFLAMPLGGPVDQERLRMAARVRGVEGVVGWW